MVGGRAGARRWGPVALAIAATWLGCGSGSSSDAGASHDDAALSCEQLRDRWWVAVEAAGLQCAVAEDCVVVGEPEGYPCDSNGDNISGDCGAVASADAYRIGAGPALEQEWSERGCRVGGIADCGWVTAECRARSCRLTETPSCPNIDGGIVDPPVPTRSGSIEVTESRIADHPELGIGASVVVEYDTMPPSTPPAYDDMVPPGTGCQVFLFGAETGQEQWDEGAVTIAGTRSPVPMCAFAAALGRYECAAVAGATSAGDTLVPAGGGHVDVTIASASFDPSHVGMYLRTSGADAPDANGLFPIVARTSSTQITIGPSPLAAATQWSSPGSYAVVAGLGPTEASVDFLGDGDIASIAKVAGPQVEGFSREIGIVGADIALSTDSDPLTGIPLGGTAVTLTCDGAGGACGSAGMTIARGRTTNADTAGLPATAMPLPTVGKYATWTCRSFAPSVVIPVDAMGVILSTGPTRIEVHYQRVSASLAGNADGTNWTWLFAGAELVGFTDVP